MKKKAKETADARAFAHKSIEVAAHQLRFAPWNPRPEGDEKCGLFLYSALVKVRNIVDLTFNEMRKREVEATPIIEREPADEVQASMDDLEAMETVNQENEEDYGV